MCGSDTAIEFQFTTEVISVTEDIQTPVTVCIELLTSTLQENITVMLQTSDDTAIGMFGEIVRPEKV